MSGVNRVILLGNVGRDAELRFTQAGRPVANFSIATSESYQDKSGQKQEKTEWHNVVCWGRLAEIAGEYVRKGRQLYVEGSLQTSSYDKDGVKQYKTEIVASNFQLLGKREESGRVQQEKPYDLGDLGPPLDMDDPPLSPGD